MQKSQQRSYVISLFSLATAGLLFSGYLSAVKLFSGTCAFNESCPYFLGFPACWYGFTMYAAMFIVTGIALIRKTNIRKVILTDILVSFLGILFAGRFVVIEFLQSRVTGTLGLSTCVYGLIFYIAIFIVSCVAYKRLKRTIDL